MEQFTENYTKLYNFIKSKKELKFNISTPLPREAINSFYSVYEKGCKDYPNAFNTRSEIKSHFPKLLRKIDLASLNFLLITPDTLSFKSLYNYFEDKQDKKYIIDTVVELLINSATYNTMLNISKSIVISNELNNTDKEFISVLTAKATTVIKSRDLTLLRDLIKYFCSYIIKEPDVILRLSDDVINIVKTLLSGYVPDINSVSNEMISQNILEAIKMVPEDKLKEFGDWLELPTKPEDFETIPELTEMIKVILKHERFGLELELPTHVIQFLFNSKNIDNIYILTFIILETLGSLGPVNKMNAVNNILDIYLLPHVEPTHSIKEQIELFYKLIMKMKDSENLLDEAKKYYNDHGREYLDKMLKQVSRNYSMNYTLDFVENYFNILIEEYKTMLM